MEVHPLLGQLDCLLAGEEAKRGKKIHSLHFIVLFFLHFLPCIISLIFLHFQILTFPNFSGGGLPHTSGISPGMRDGSAHVLRCLKVSKGFISQISNYKFFLFFYTKI